MLEIEGERRCKYSILNVVNDDVCSPEVASCVTTDDDLANRPVGQRVQDHPQLRPEELVVHEEEDLLEKKEKGGKTFFQYNMLWTMMSGVQKWSIMSTTDVDLALQPVRLQFTIIRGSGQRIF